MSSKRKPVTKGKKSVSKSKKRKTDKTPRFIVLITTLVLVGALLAGGIALANIAIQNGPTPGFYVNGSKRAKESDPFLSIGEFQISYNEYRFYYLSIKAQMEAQYGETYFTEDPDGAKEKQLFEDTEAYIRNTYVWQSYAKEKGLFVTLEEKQKIQDDCAENRATNHEMYLAWLRNQHYADEATYVLIQEKIVLNQKAQEAFLEEMHEVHADDWMDEVATAQHILFLFPDGADDDAKAAILLEAQQAYESIMAAADSVSAFETMRAASREYNTEYGMWINYGNDGGQPEEGYTFGPGYMVESFYQAAIGLRVNGISEPVETTYGYHIVRRCELDVEAAEADKDAIMDRLANSLFNQYQEKTAKAFIVIGGTYYYETKIACIK